MELPRFMRFPLFDVFLANLHLHLHCNCDLTDLGDNSHRMKCMMDGERTGKHDS